MKVSVFGLGYVGSVSAASFAADGHEVVGVDVNPDKVASLNEGRSPIVEPGLDDLLARRAVRTVAARDDQHRRGGPRDRPVADLRRHAEPEERRPGPDLPRSRVREIGEASRDKTDCHVVVVRSTVLPGTTHDVVIPTLEHSSGKKAGDGFRRGGQPGIPARRHGASRTSASRR